MRGVAAGTGGPARQRGTALFLVLVVTLILLLMVGAFMTIHRDHFSLVRSQADRDAALRAARSVIQYCLFRLEHDKYWADEEFSADWTENQFPEGFLEVTQIGGTRCIEGSLRGSGVAYRAEILNNINDPAIDDGVRPGFARVAVRVETPSGFARDYEIMLRTAPFFDSSAVTTGDLVISEKSRWRIGSRDPYRNHVRVMGEIRAPRTEQLEFFGERGGEDQGTVWAKGDILVAGGSLSRNENLLRRVEAATGGLFMPEARGYYDVPDLEKGDFLTPEVEKSLPPGQYVFADVKVTWDGYPFGLNPEVAAQHPDGVPVRMLQRRVTDLNAGDVGLVGKDGYLNLEDYWYDQGFGGISADRLEVLALNPRFIDEDQVVYFDPERGHAVDPNDFAVHYPELRASMPFPAKTALPGTRSDPPILRITGDVKYTVKGDFGVSVSHWDSDDQDIRPTVYLGGTYGDDGSARTNTSVQADSGSINIEGVLIGRGKLLADEDVRFCVSTADLEAEATSHDGLAVYAGQNVNLSTWGKGGSAVFTGLVYARKKFSFHSDDQKLRVEGALVAGEQGIHSTGTAPEIEFVYNPLYLEGIVKELPEDRIHLERFVWKE